MSAPGRPRSGLTYPGATAFTDPQMPAPPGTIWTFVNRGSSAASASIPTTPISSTSLHLATSSVPTRNAGCSDRAMAARAGAMFFWNIDLLGTDFLAPASSVWTSIDDAAGCRFDFKIIFDDGITQIRRNVNVCGVEKYAISFR